MSPEAAKTDELAQAAQNGAQDARIEILLTQAGDLFNLHRDLIANGLPQCRVEAKRIDSLEAAVRDLARTVQKAMLAITILFCAVFGVDRVLNWYNAKADKPTQQTEASMVGTDAVPSLSHNLFGKQK